MTTDAATLEKPADAVAETPVVADTPAVKEAVKEEPKKDTGQPADKKGAEGETEDTPSDEEAAAEAKATAENANPYRAAAVEAARGDSADYQRGLEEARRAFGKDRQADTRKDVNSLFSSVESKLDKTLLEHAFQGANGFFNMSPEQAASLGPVIKREVLAAKNGVLNLAINESRDLLEAALMKTLPNDASRTKARTEIAGAIQGADPVDRDALWLATAIEVAAEHTKAYKDLSKQLASAKADGYDEGHKAGRVLGLNAHRGDGPSGNGHSSGAQRGTVEWAQTAPIAELLADKARRSGG